LFFQRAARAGTGPVKAKVDVVLESAEPIDGPLIGRALILIVLRDVDEVGLAERPCAFALDVIGFGTNAVMPASSHALISRLLK
jgi:hypothetical protein